MTLTPRALASGLMAAFLLSAPGHAQKTPVYQSGRLTPGDLTKSITNGMVGTVGTLTGDTLGFGVNPFAVYDRGGIGLTLHNAQTSGPYSGIELGHDSVNGTGTLRMRSYNGAPDNTLTISAKDIIFDVDGTPISIGPLLSGLPTSVVVDFRVLGGIGNGIADNTDAFRDAMSYTTSPTIYFPSGTYRIDCGTYTALSAVSLYGDGAGRSILKLAPGCTQPAHLLEYLASNNVVNGPSIRGLTIDLNDAATSGSPNTPIIYFEDVSNWVVDGSSVINAAGNSLLVFGTATSGNTMKNYRLTNNRLHRTNPEPDVVNYCFGTSNAGGLGTVTGGIADKNICENTSMQVVGYYNKVTGNDISGFNFGTGIFEVQNVSGFNTYEGNIIHDSGTTVDVNGTPSGGFDADGTGSVYRGNICRNLGGWCIQAFGTGNMIDGNISENVNLGSQSPDAAANDRTRAPWQVASNTGPDPDLLATDNTFQNNIDLGGSFQTYCYNERDVAGTGSGMKLRNNRCAPQYEQKYRITYGNTTSDWEVIAVRNAAVSASLEWLNIDKSYNAFKLGCSTVAPATGAVAQIVFGQGDPNVWRTTPGDYFTAGSWQRSDTGTSHTFGSETASAITLGEMSVPIGSAMSFTAEINSLEIGFRKAVKYSGVAGIGLGSTVNFDGSGRFVANTDPVRHIKFEFAGANTSTGYCTLWGRI